MEVDALRNQLGVLLAALDNVDATIRVFKPDIDIEDLPRTSRAATQRRVPGRGPTLPATHAQSRWRAAEHFSACGSGHGIPAAQHG